MNENYTSPRDNCWLIKHGLSFETIIELIYNGESDNVNDQLFAEWMGWTE